MATSCPWFPAQIPGCVLKHPPRLLRFLSLWSFHPTTAADLLLMCKAFTQAIPQPRSCFSHLCSFGNLGEVFYKIFSHLERQGPVACHLHYLQSCTSYLLNLTAVSLRTGILSKFLLPQSFLPLLPPSVHSLFLSISNT